MFAICYKCISPSLAVACFVNFSGLLVGSHCFSVVLGLQQAEFQGQDFCFVSLPGLFPHGHTILKRT